MTTVIDSKQSFSEHIHIYQITSYAAKRLERLSGADRRRIEKAIGAPVHKGRCRLLNGMSGLRIFHFDASRSLRVTFRFLGGGACVLHAGTHPDFEKFVAGYVGDTTSRRFPVQALDPH